MATHTLLKFPLWLIMQPSLLFTTLLHLLPLFLMLLLPLLPPLQAP